MLIQPYPKMDMWIQKQVTIICFTGFTSCWIKVLFFSVMQKDQYSILVVKRDAVKTELPGLNVPVIIKDSVVIGPVNGNNRPKAEVYVPSKRVYTFKDGYVRIVLPYAGDKKYSIKFFTPEDEMLFE